MRPQLANGKTSRQATFDKTTSKKGFEGYWHLMAQMHMFGEMVMESQERERSNFVPRRRSTKIRETYARLPMEGITTELLVSGGTRDLKGASGTLNIWLADGLVIRDKKNYRNVFKKILE